MNQIKYLTGSEVARRSNGAISYNRVRNAILSGDLFAQKLGQSYVVLDDEADRWIAEQIEKDKPVLGPLQQRIADLEAQVVALGGVV